MMVTESERWLRCAGRSPADGRQDKRIPISCCRPQRGGGRCYHPVPYDLPPAVPIAVPSLSMGWGLALCSAMPTVRAATTRPVVVSLATHPPTHLASSLLLLPRLLDTFPTRSAVPLAQRRTTRAWYRYTVYQYYAPFAASVYLYIYAPPRPHQQASRQARSSSTSFSALP